MRWCDRLSDYPLHLTEEEGEDIDISRLNIESKEKDNYMVSEEDEGIYRKPSSNLKSVPSLRGSLRQ